MSRHTLTLTFFGPVATSGEQIASPLVDRPMVRDALGRPVLPGSHVKGRLREAVEQVASLTDAAEFVERLAAHLFGDARRPGRVTVDDLVLQGETAGDEPDETGGSGDPLPPLTAAHLQARWQSPSADFAALPQVALDRRHGRALDRALAFREGPGFGRETRWQGAVTLPDGGLSPLSAAQVEAVVLAALRWLDGVGAENQTGWGWIAAKQWEGTDLPEVDAEALGGALSAAATLPEVTLFDTEDAPGPEEGLPPAIPAPECSAGYRWLEVAAVLHGPLLVAEHQASDNFLESADHLPGSVLKRALADLLLAAAGADRNGWIDPGQSDQYRGYQALAAAFDGLQVRHGLPVDPGWAEARLADSSPLDRPLVVPWTALAQKGAPGVVGDALLPYATETWTEHGAGRPTLWFERSEVPDYLCSGERRPVSLRRFHRTRTATSRTLRAAEQSALFTHRALHPLARQTPGPEGELTGQRQLFVFALGVPAGEDTERALQQLRAALGQIRHLGKGVSAGYGAVRLFALHSGPAPKAAAQERATAWAINAAGAALGDALPVTLNSDALLLDPDALEGDYGADLTPHYTEAWNALVRRALTPQEQASWDAAGGLSLHPRAGLFARQVLRGGRTARGPLAAAPVVLTRAGSTFLLVPNSEAARPLLKEALLTLAERGVERPELIQTVETRWGRLCPYRASNGYGEIVLCHPNHLPPSEGEETER